MLAAMAFGVSVNAIDWIEDSDTRSNVPLANILSGVNTVGDFKNELARVYQRYSKVYTPAAQADYNHRALSYACYIRIRELIEGGMLSEKAQEGLKKFIYLVYNKADYDALDEKEFVKALSRNDMTKLAILHKELYELQLFMLEDFDHPQDPTAPGASNEK